MGEEQHNSTEFQLGILSGQMTAMVATLATLQATFAAHVAHDTTNFEKINSRLNKYAGGLAVLTFIAGIIGPIIANKLTH
jgi:hypothetical protein